MAGKAKTRAERLFAAAVLRRSFELQDRQYAPGFRFVYEGVLRDYGLEDAEVAAYLEGHRAQIERAIGRSGAAPAPRRGPAGGGDEGGGEPGSE